MKQHVMERRLELLEESYQIDLQRIIDASTIEGRPMFHVALSMDDELARWRDPVLRAAIEKQIWATGGPQAVLDYHSKMAELENRQFRKLGLGGV